jgi:uncharacterized membrane protein YeaQ/YmgE (transglycosylase-associated protein family)
MEISVSQVVVWILVGTLAGSLAGLVVKRQRSGFGHLGNLAVGLVGAAIGLFAGEVLEIKIEKLVEIAINLNEVVLAFVGSLVFLAVLAICRRFWGKKKRGELES